MWKGVRDPMNRRLIASLTALASICGVGLVLPNAAHADTGLYYNVVDSDNANDGGVYYRNSPSWNDSSRTYGVDAHYGETVELVCYEWGDAVGPYQNRLWHLVSNVTRPSAGEGFLPDHYLNTPVTANQLVPGEPECGSSGGSSADTTTPNLNYNRSAAVAWALAHAQDPQAYGAMCTWFVSNALWAGGLPKSAAWTDQGSYTSAPGTKDAWVVPDFLNYIQSNFSTTLTPLDNLSQNAVPQAEPGDIIEYDWGNGGGVSHLAFVVGIADGQYPEVAEMGQFQWGLIDYLAAKIGIDNTSPYVERGWTWSVMNNSWLQDEDIPMAHGGGTVRGHVTAYLLHINGGIFVPNF